MADQTSRFNAILLFGAPGAGKGTQGKMLAAIPGFCHVSTGDMFRSLDESTDLGKEIGGYMSAGDLVPDELTMRLLRDHLSARIAREEFNPDADLIVLDGVPRSTEQAELLEPLIAVQAVVHLTADARPLIERLKRRAVKEHRPDDAEEDVVQHRLEVYEQETRPVLNVYPPEKVHEIDAIGLPARVLHRVLETVVPIVEQHAAAARSSA